MRSLPRRIARRAVKPLYRLYYRRLYGRDFPGAQQLGRWVSRWEEGGGLGDVPLSRSDWEAQYQRGDWRFLDGAPEVPRYTLIAGLLHRLRPGASVLDVGCGEGILRDYLLPFGRAPYTGIDLSQEAIARGAARRGDGASFAVADAEEFEPAERYGAIVLNECLYYFRRPLATAKRYRAHLDEDGVLLVSMYKSVRTAAIARRLYCELTLVEALELSGRQGTWMVSLHR